MKNAIKDKIYFNNPIFVQNIMISAYGYYLHKQRYSGNYKNYLKGLLESQYFSKEEIYELQKNEMLKILKHSFQNVPYYREISNHAGLSINDFSSLEDIQKLSILDKEVIRTNPEYICAENILQKRKIFILNTSGTSGKPLNIYCDDDSRQHHYAFWGRLRAWNGINPGMKRATFFGRIIVAPDVKNSPFWRYDYYNRNYLFSSYHMSESNLYEYCKKLFKIQPEEVIGYPSSLFILAKYLKKNNLSGINPRIIFTTAETLLSHQRELIESQFKCKVVDQYGCTEMALFVSQCEKGTYHIHPEHGYVEVVDEKGSPVNIGEEGEAVCTSFINYTMPLIRYRLGDRIKLMNQDCDCGRNFPVISQILGRMDDILITPDGRPLGRLDPVFKGMKGIYETQIVQTAKDCLELKIVIDATFTNKDMKDLIYEIRNRTGEKMTIKLDIVKEIPKDRNGKFRSVISNIL